MIKYINVCVDVNTYLQDLIDKIEKETSIKETKETVGKMRVVTIIRDFIIPVLLTAWFAYNDIKLFGGLTGMFYVLVGMFIFNSASHIMLYRQTKRKVNKRREQAETAKKLKEALPEIPIEDALEKMRSFSDVANFLYTCYCTDAAHYEYKNGVVVIGWVRNGIIGYEVISKIYDNSNGDINTLSVTKDGVFLNHYDIPLKHAVKTFSLVHDVLINKTSIKGITDESDLTWDNIYIAGGEGIGLESKSKLSVTGR